MRKLLINIPFDVIAYEILPYIYLPFSWFYFKYDSSRKLYQSLSRHFYYGERTEDVILHRNIKHCCSSRKLGLSKKMKYESLCIEDRSPFIIMELDLSAYRYSLRKLMIDESFIPFEILLKLEKLEDLTLNLWSKKYFNGLWQLKKLRKLNIKSYGGLILDFKNLSNLTALTMECFFYIGWEFLRYLGNLEVLTIRRFLHQTDENLLSFVGKKFRRIYLIGCPNVTLHNKDKKIEICIRKYDD